MSFYTNEVGTEDYARLTIKGNGKIGVGTMNAASKLHVSSGDVYIDTAGRGIILKSPGGGCFRAEVSNSGSITTSQIGCP